MDRKSKALKSTYASPDAYDYNLADRYFEQVNQESVTSVLCTRTSGLSIPETEATQSVLAIAASS